MLVDGCREGRRRERLEREVKEVKAALEGCHGELAQRTAQHAASQDQVHRLEMLLRDSNVRLTSASKHLDPLTPKGFHLKSPNSHCLQIRCTASR